jgi:hypothetical protein
MFDFNRNWNIDLNRKMSEAYSLMQFTHNWTTESCIFRLHTQLNNLHFIHFQAPHTITLQLDYIGGTIAITIATITIGIAGAHAVHTQLWHCTATYMSTTEHFLLTQSCPADQPACRGSGFLPNSHLPGMLQPSLDTILTLPSTVISPVSALGNLDSTLAIWT